MREKQNLTCFFIPLCICLQIHLASSDFAKLTPSLFSPHLETGYAMSLLLPWLSCLQG